MNRPPLVTTANWNVSKCCSVLFSMALPQDIKKSHKNTLEFSLRKLNAEGKNRGMHGWSAVRWRRAARDVLMFFFLILWGNIANRVTWCCFYFCLFIFILALGTGWLSCEFIKMFCNEHRKIAPCIKNKT